jgi:hypothetical protein
MIRDAVPEVIAAQVWARRQTGESRPAVSLWLSRLGYLVRADEVDVIASHYGQRRDATGRGRTR